MKHGSLSLCNAAGSLQLNDESDVTSIGSKNRFNHCRPGFALNKSCERSKIYTTVSDEHYTASCTAGNWLPKYCIKRSPPAAMRSHNVASNVTQYQQSNLVTSSAGCIIERTQADDAMKPLHGRQLSIGSGDLNFDVIIQLIQLFKCASVKLRLQLGSC